MSTWEIYEQRISAHGSTPRGNTLQRGKRILNTKLPRSLSYQEVIIDGIDRNTAIIDSDNLDEKIMYSMPGEDIDCGGLVEWAENRWLVTEKDAHNELHTRVKLKQCNYLLKWVDSDNVIHEQWCVVEDGTKYLTGEYEDRNFVVTRGDSRVAMTIAKNEDTMKFGRQHRFLIDELGTGRLTAYLLTKPLQVGKTYNGKGVYSFVLQEVVSTDNDNFELGIADYYKHFNRNESDNSDNTLDNTPDNITEPSGNGKKVWL